MIAEELTKYKQLVAQALQLNPSCIQISKLHGGLTNSTFKLKTPLQSFVLRLFGKNSQIFSNRESEKEFLEYFASQGIAPKLHAINRKMQFMVVEYIDGNPLQGSELNQPKMLEDILHVQSKVHRSDFAPSLHLNIKNKLKKLINFKVKHTETIHPHHYFLINRILKKHPSILIKAAPCHFDFLPNNIIRNRFNQLVLIDWEYACHAPIALELANFILDLKPKNSDLLQHIFLTFNKLHPPAMHISEAELNAALVVSAIYWFHWTRIQKTQGLYSLEWNRYLQYYARIINSHCFYKNSLPEVSLFR